MTLAAFVVAMLVSAGAASAQVQSDEAVLRERIAAHQMASEHGNLRGLVDVYAPDAQVISQSGRVLRGRDAIEADYSSSLQTAASKSGRHHVHPADSIRIEFVTPDVAIIDVDSVSVGGTDAGGTALANSGATKLLTVWRKRGGQWLVVYQRALPAVAKTTPQ